jgi:predicted 3-demethylubiquinone-9 3-methyltransferase (glyoxalase superfamily)
MQKLTSCLWFDNNGLEAAKFYVSVFKKQAKLGKVAYYGEGMPGKAGSVMTVEFKLLGQDFLALNGGPIFKFTEAVSFVVNCKTQREVDYYWKKLSAGGKEVQCGWLRDKFGLSWQIVPTILGELAASKDRAKADRVMQAMMGMVKLDITALKAAAKKKT